MRRKAAFLLPLGCAVVACGSSAPATPPAKVAPAPALADGAKLDRVAGACDASALAISPDGTLVVAFDEGSSLLRWTADGKALPPTDLAALVPEGGLNHPLERTKKGVAREFDQEGVAKIGDRLLWLGSHSRGKSGDRRDNQRLLIATTIPSSTEAPAILGVSDGLYAALLALPDVGPRLAAVEVESGPENQALPPKKGGLNLEGITEDFTGAGVWLGFRSPLGDSPTAGALVVHLDNPDDVVLRGQPPMLTGARWLNLDGHGIRAMATDVDPQGKPNRYLLISGPVGELPPDESMTIYAWDGVGEPSRVYTLPPGFGAEALALTPDSAVVLSDEGGRRTDVLVNDKPADCKDVAKKTPQDPAVYFQRLVLPIGLLRPGIVAPRQQ